MDIYQKVDELQHRVNILQDGFKSLAEQVMLMHMAVTHQFTVILQKLKQQQDATDAIIGSCQKWDKELGVIEADLKKATEELEAAKDELRRVTYELERRAK